MKIKNAVAVTRRRIDLGLGVVVTGKPLDALGHAAALAEAEAELEALRSDDGAARHDWGLSLERLDALRAEGREADAMRMLVRSWMRSVLVATAFAETLEGVVEDDGATPSPPSFAAFRFLFGDATIEAAFRVRAAEFERLWDAEGNASGRGRTGSGAAAQDSAKAAASKTPPAPEANLSMTLTAPADAPSSSMNPNPNADASPGGSPPSPASGSAPA